MKKLIIFTAVLFLYGTVAAQTTEQAPSTQTAAQTQVVTAPTPATESSTPQQTPAVAPVEVKTETAAAETPAKSNLGFYLTGNLGLAMSIESNGKDFKDASAVMGGLGFGMHFLDIARLEIAATENSITQEKQPGYTYDVSIDTTFVMCNLLLDVAKPGESGPYVGVGVGSASTKLSLPSSKTKLDIGSGTATAIYLGYGIAMSKQFIIDLGIDYYGWKSEKIISGVKYKADFDEILGKVGIRWYFM